MMLFRRIVPEPSLSVALVGLWLAMARSMDLAQVLLGLVLALVVPLVTAGLRSAPVRLRRPAVAGRFLLLVIHDVLRENFEVARDLVAWSWRRPSARFVTIPLDLRHPVGLTVLAMVTTIVPGTVWSELSLDRSVLLLHVWNASDEDAFVARFKARYEQPLRRIFE